MSRLERIVAFLIAWEPPPGIDSYVFAVEPGAGLVTVSLSACCLQLVLKVPADARPEQMDGQMREFAACVLATLEEKHRSEGKPSGHATRSGALREGAEAFLDGIYKRHGKTRDN